MFLPVGLRILVWQEAKIIRARRDANGDGLAHVEVQSRGPCVIPCDVTEGAKLCPGYATR
jgi:hypothetical protein